MMINNIIGLLKYWKAGGIVLLMLAFLLSFHLAKSRGERLENVTRSLSEERQKFQTQLKLIEKARQDDKERNQFRNKQAKKIKLADNDSLHDAYEFLRERQAGLSAR